MAFSMGNVATCSINGVDVSQYVSEIDPTYERDRADLPRIGGFPVAHLPGPLNKDIAINGWYDPVIDALLVGIVEAEPQVAVPITWRVQPGDTLKSGNYYLETYNPPISAEDASSFSSQWMLE